MEFPPFPGIRPAAFEFLTHLANNNERSWFKANKASFDEELIWPLRCLLVETDRLLQEINIPLIADPKRSIFRIYRDTRFSKNKQPYKTHVGAVLSRSGTTKDQGAVYLHIQPGKCFLAAGFWRPENTLLRAWRLRMISEPESFLDLVASIEKKGLSLHAESTLKRMPRGFETYTDAPVTSYLKWKSFTLSKPFPDDAITDQAFAEVLVAWCVDVLPLLQFGWDLQHHED